MDYKEFSGKIKAKYPQYADMADEELAAKMVAKFPTQYGDVQLKDAPNSPTAAPASDPSHPDHPDNTMQYLAKMAKAIYGTTPMGVGQNLAGKAMQAGEAAAPGAAQWAANNGDVMLGAGGGALAAAPYAPAAGPFAPLVPVAGAALGAIATRTAVRPMQAALGRPGESYATASDLAQAGKEGAMQEAGGQMLTAGIKMGADGLAAAKKFAIDKAKEILPDMGENLLSIPSESINRVLDRFKDFKGPLKDTFNGPRRAAQFRSDHIAENALEDVNNQILRARKVAGKSLEITENQFVPKAADTPIVDAGDLNAAINEWKAANPALADSPDVKKIAEAVARYKPAGNAVSGISAGEPVLAKDAIALRRELDSLSTWNAGGVRAVENDAADRLAKDLSSHVRENIRTAAEKVNPAYARRLTEFADLADAHNNALGTLRTVGGTDKAIAMKLDNLSGMFNSGGAKQEALTSIGTGVKGGEKIQQAVAHLSDALAVRSFQKVPKRIPSGVMLRIVNTIAPTRTAVGAAGSALSGAGSSAAAPYTVGPAGQAGSRLAAALAAQQTGE